jgi:uncharacterized iron-regulated protein
MSKHTETSRSRQAVTPLPLAGFLILTVMATSGWTTASEVTPETTAAAHSGPTEAPGAMVAMTPVLDLNAFSTVEQLIPVLAGKRVVFVGEQHNRLEHHLVQLEIIRRLHEQHPQLQLAIGMEVFQQPFQQHLDDYVAGAITEQQMLRATEYYERWRMDYRLYAPILRYAREHGLPVVALNLPSELTRKVGRVGLAGLTPGELTRLPAEIDRSDSAYEQRIRDVFESHPNNNDQPFEHFFEVQLLWDEGMAERAAGFLQAHPEHLLVVLAGAGHLAFGSAIPQRLTRRFPADSTIILNSWQGTIEPGLADFLLLPAERSLRPAGKMGAVLDVDDDGIKVAACFEDSPCSTANIQAGDRLTAIDTTPVKTMADVPLALWDKQPGDTVTVSIMRKRWPFPARTLTHEITLQ